MSIEVSITGYEKLGIISLNFNPAMFKAVVTGIVSQELMLIAESIQQDPNIPVEYKKAIFVSVNESTGKVSLGVFVPGEMKWKRWGKVMEWQNYICPIRKYYGGELAPEYNGPSYVKEKFKQMAPQVKSNIRNRVISYIKSGVS
jgi:hypothetical protein